MAITPADNSAYISIALGNGDIRTFPKGATLIDLVKDKVIVKDISTQAGEPVTLDWSDIAGTPYATNTALHAALVAYLDTGVGSSGSSSSGDTVTKDGRTSQYVAMGFTDTQTVHIDVQTNSSEIAYMVIDLSDTTNWKHTNTGEIIIEYIIIQVDPASNFLGEIKLGYLTNVGGTNGDFNQILDIDMARKSDIISEVIDFGSHGLHCTDSNHFGSITANSTLFQTDVNLGGPDDPTTTTYPSGDGDLVLLVDGDGTNFVDVSLTIGYETVA